MLHSHFLITRLPLCRQERQSRAEDTLLTSWHPHDGIRHAGRPGQRRNGPKIPMRENPIFEITW